MPTKMKLQQLVVLTFTFVLQLQHSECKPRFSLSDTFNISLNIGQHRDKFIDSMKGIFTEDGAKSTTDDTYDTVSRLEGQDPRNPNMNNDNINNIFLKGERDDFMPPEKQREHKISEEDLIVHMTSMTTPQLIAMHGYPAETHTVVTDDGYILTIHRIPYTKNNQNKVSPKKTVLLHHGLLGSSAHWVIPGPIKGLGYILSEAGYDVWMANVRGNTYSRAHVSRNVDSYEFWNFTFHEVSQHDLPAVIDYIMEVKGGDVKINYIGHSMGTTVLFALLSTKTEYNKVLRAGFALAPVAYMTNIKSPIKLLAEYTNEIHFLMKLFGGANVFLPENPVLKWFSKHSLEVMSIDKERNLEDVMSILFGHNVEQFNLTLLPLILSQGAADASTKTVIHYAQEIQQSGKFQMFDNGPEGNVKAYGTVFPPEYPLHKITLPIALFSSENDWFSSVHDAKSLYKKLVNPIDHYIVPLKEFNHIDFLWAIDAPTLLYSRLLQLLEQDFSKL